jgi:hypothetical protein
MSDERFTLYIQLGNDAFADGNEAAEVARILRYIARNIAHDDAVPRTFQTIRDINGNDVGRYAIKPNP